MNIKLSENDKNEKSPMEQHYLYLAVITPKIPVNIVTPHIPIIPPKTTFLI